MKKNLIVFDIDDTLTKSENQHQLAYVNTMKEFGITNINQNWKEYLHHTDSYILKENYENNLSDKFDFSFIPAFEKRMTEIILTLEKTTEIKGAKDFITQLIQEKNYAFSFATGSLLDPVLVKLSHAEIPFEKDLVVSSNTFFSREEIVQEAINRAKEHYQTNEFEHIISVGDGIWDLKTARNLGLHFMGIRDKNLADFKEENIKMHIKDWEGFDIKEMEKVFGMN